MKITKEQRQEKIDSIVDNAIEVFVLKGYQESSFIDIAKKMGIARSTIYLYFKDKNELLKACLRRKFLKNKELFFKIDFQKTQDQSEKLQNLIDKIQFFYLHEDQRKFYSMIASLAINDHEIANIWYEESLCFLKQLWTNVCTSLNLPTKLQEFYFTMFFSVFFSSCFSNECFKENKLTLDFCTFMQTLKEVVLNHELSLKDKENE